MIWKVRPMPASQSSCGLRPDISRPSSRTRPVSGRKKPFSRLNSVVLPAPLGPMMPRISSLPQLEADILHGLQSAEGARQVTHLEHDIACPGGPLGPQRHEFGGGGVGTSGAAGVAVTSAADRLRQKSRTFQYRPSGASRMTQMMARP